MTLNRTSATVLPVLLLIVPVLSLTWAGGGGGQQAAAPSGEVQQESFTSHRLPSGQEVAEQTASRRSTSHEPCRDWTRGGGGGEQYFTHLISFSLH